ADAERAAPGSARDSKSNDTSMMRNPLTNHSDVLQHLIPFITGEGYLFLAGASKHWNTAWGSRPKEASLPVAVQSATCLAWARDSGCPWDERVCCLAALEG
ncbi:unnamed protein product, partial [Sphacelaria rigidula]